MLLIIYWIFLIFSCFLYYFFRRQLSSNLLIADGGFLNLLAYFVGMFLVDFNTDSVVASNLLFFSLITMFSYPLGIAIYLANKKKHVLNVNLQHQVLLSQFLIQCLSFLIIAVNISFTVKVYRSLVIAENLLNLLDIRKAISSGNHGYFAPGLIKQVRDICAPAFLSYLIAFHQDKKLLKFTIFLSTFIAIIVGGQRLPVMILFVGIIFAYSLRRKIRNSQTKLSYFVIIFYILLMIGMVGLVNILLGRDSLESDTSLISSVIMPIYKILFRAVATVPQENVMEMPLLASMNFTFMSEWVTSLASFLHIHSDMALTNQLAAYLGGEDTGNAVLGFPLDTYINAGVMGLFIFPPITAYVACMLDRLVIRANNAFITMSKYIVVIYAYVWYSPYLAILNGGLFLMFVLVCRQLFPQQRLYYMSPQS